MGKLIDLSGQRFGRLVVVKEAGRSSNGKALWLCECDCGNRRIFYGEKLRCGETRSCGCYRREITGKQFRKYNQVNKRIYRIWKLMHKRCYNPNDPKYNNYGGRGIIICPEWVNDFLSFQAWALGNGYTEHLTIDRIDVNGPYSPDNCRWTTNKVQCNNKTDNVVLEYQGESHTLSEWAHITGIKYSTLAYRASRGWTAQEILTLPPQFGNRVKKHK